MKNQRKTIIALTLVLIIALTIIPISVEAKPSKLPKGLEKKIPKKGFIVKTDLGDVIRYREYIPLDIEALESYIPPNMGIELPDAIYYSVNVYAYENDGSVVLIDSGHELLAKKLFARIRADFGKKPIIVLLTHGHAEHAGGGSFLQKHGAEIYVHEADEMMVQLGHKFPGMTVPEHFTYTGYDPLTYDSSEIAGCSIIPTPGHTYGSVCLLHQNTGILFTGDLTIPELDLIPFEDPDITSEMDLFSLLYTPPEMLELQISSITSVMMQISMNPM
jgi:glyoxylase-like metal-dependent hydrolase (beta-lactamase superfamily II)